LKNLFLLDKDIIYLNHGSFGATPKPIFDDYVNWQKKLENQPVNFIEKKLPNSLLKSRTSLANYINCSKDDIVFFPNPTTAINTIIKSLKIGKNDIVLSTNHEYGALKRSWKYYSQKRFFHFQMQKISLPIIDKKQFLKDFWSGFTKEVKIIFISHITSETALIFPVKEICKKARELGILTIIDGAHVPGHIPLDIADLKPDFYIGACHKWMCAPKGVSFLYADQTLQALIDPLVVSWGWESDRPSHSKFLDYHQWQGTNDMSAYLTIPFVINFLKNNNWESHSKECKNKIIDTSSYIMDLLNIKPISPLNNQWLGQMCSIPLNIINFEQFRIELYEKYKIEIPIFKFENYIFLRLSINVYNSDKEIDFFVNAIKNLLPKYVTNR